MTQTYDAKGRPWRQSLPFNPFASPAETEYHATTSYDGANRVVSVTTDDGSTTATAYNGNITTVTDQAGAARALTSDGFGRLKQVVEDSTGKNYTTAYTYDVLDDLKTVSQGTLTQRTFNYDWLKRLVTAYNPESGTICYGAYVSGVCNESYDANGNLLNRTDANSVVTTFTYDHLNRPLTKSYTGGKTPTVTFAYDSAAAGTTCSGGAATYDTGRLTSITTPSLASPPLPSTAEYLNYDALGRICFSQEKVGTPAYTFGYQYNLASGLISETYPSGRVLDTAFDSQNRPATVTSGATNYASLIAYASSDAVSQILFGGISSAPVATQNIAFDHAYTTLRAQPTGITVTTGTATPLTLNYWYCPGKANSCGGANGNNGNPLYAQILTSAGLNLSQTFGYDKVNRLTSAAETGGSSEWSQTYLYDAWGNRAVTAGYIPYPYATPNALTQYANNRWNGTGAGYDLGGNQTALTARTFTYDGENRLLTSTQPGMGAIAYAYDGEGRRVQKTVGGVTTVYVYDGGGQLAAEYSTAAQTVSGTQYVVQDTLGSTRLLLDSGGMVSERFDYLPFGEEIPAGVGSRAAPYSTFSYPSGTPDQVNAKFTGKERDAETGLDYFGARYFSSAQGRWTSPDWSAVPQPVPYADLTDPQTLNLYSYVRNNPLSRADADGHCDGVASCLWGGLQWAGSTAAAGAALIQTATVAAAGAATAAVVYLASPEVPGAIPSPNPGHQFAMSQDAVRSGTANSYANDANENYVPSGKQGQAQGQQSTPADPGNGPQNVGNNPRDTKGRTNTDLPGGHEAAKSTFDQRTQGQQVVVDPKTGHQVAADGTRLRLNPDGTARVDIPKNQNNPKHETIHFNNPDKPQN